MVNTAVVVVVLVRLAAAFVNTLFRHGAEKCVTKRTLWIQLLWSCLSQVSPRITLRLGIFWKSRYVRSTNLAPAKREA